MIELDNVRKVYEDGTVAVDNVDFEVNRGETVTLVGPSGCGKTTTMTMVNRLTEITDGDIVIDGESVLDHDPIDLRRNIGYVIQEIGLFDHMTIVENISIVPDLRGWSEERKEERVEELLDLIQLPHSVKDQYPANLSGGQRQRVGVARALAAEPDILLMDEPFGALDPITREELQDEFLSIQEELDVTIMFVTHDIDEALKMGDKVAVLNDGQLVQYDAPKELLRNPANEFVEDFIGGDRFLKQLSEVQVQEVMTTSSNGKGVNQTSVSPEDSLKVALQRIVQSGGPVAVIDDGEVVGRISENDICSVTGDPASEVIE